MKYTENYGFDKPEGTDFVDVEHFNANTEQLDKLLCPEYTEEKTIAELQSGEKLSTAFGKLAKAVSDYISHKADQVAHITAEERTAWNAKLGVEKIAANLTTDTDGMVLAAAMGKNLKEQIDTNANAISTLNSNINKTVFFSKSIDYTCKTTDYENTGVTITIPAGSFFCVGARQSYSYSSPTGIALSTSDMSSWNLLAHSEASSACSASGYTKNEITITVYAKWDSLGGNGISLGGFYRKI